MPYYSEQWNRYVYRFIAVAVMLMIALFLDKNRAQALTDRVVVSWFFDYPIEYRNSKVQQIVEEFNNRQDKILLKLDCGCTAGGTSSTHLMNRIISGNPPDILGPIALNHTGLKDQWLDFAPLVKKYNYNLARFPQPVVDLHRENGKLVGLPFVLWPGLIYYNVDLFDKAGLEYPPAKFGQNYQLDGKQVTWDWNTLAELSKRLTLDVNGNNANHVNFDEDNIVQFGFVHQWDTIRSDFSTFGGASVVNDQGKVVIPEHWREHAKWMQDAMWKHNFMPNATHLDSDLLKPNAFASGKVAMARSMLWYTCCFKEMEAKWDIAAMPSYKGQVYVPTEADTFHIHKDSQNPDAAFQVVEYLIHDAAPLVIENYFYDIGFHFDLQDTHLTVLAKQYPSVKNWQVLKASLDHTVIPSHSSVFPNLSKGTARFEDFLVLLYSDMGKDIDIDKELDKLEADLQTVIKEEPVQMPTEPPSTEAASRE